MIQEDFLLSSGGRKIFVSRYGKTKYVPKSGRNCLVFANGMWQYPAQYNKFIEGMVEKFDIVSPHYLGHGKSKYDGTYLLSDLVQNVRDTINCAASQYDKVVLFGYSMGGIVSSKLATEEGLPLKGIICITVIVPEMAETFKEAIRIPFIHDRKRFLKFVDFLDRKVPKGWRFPEFIPRMVFRVGSSRAVKELINDPLSLKFYRKEFLISLLRTDMKDFLEKEIEYPFTIAASIGDGFVPCEYQLEIFNRIKVKDNNKNFLLLKFPRTHFILQELAMESAGKIAAEAERLFNIGVKSEHV